MAVGDIISGVQITSYQPSAGVEIIVTWVGVNNSNRNIGLDDGISQSSNHGGNRDTPETNHPLAAFTGKIGITNTNYLYCNSHFGFSGIQIK